MTAQLVIYGLLSEWLGAELQPPLRRFESGRGLQLSKVYQNWYNSDMLAIIGTYRKDAYVFDLLDSMKEYVTGITKLHFIDDSGDVDFAIRLAEYGDVTSLNREGYNAAMQEAVKVATSARDHVAFIEEDFTFIAPIDFYRLAAHLDSHPYLAQIVLQREPWFDAEKEYGSIIEFHQKKKRQIFRDVDEFWEHTAFFSCNPALWHQKTWESGWPEGQWSEDKKRLSLLKGRKKFALTKNIVVEHHGERSGHGY
jgi:hypothetical protein